MKLSAVVRWSHGANRGWSWDTADAWTGIFPKTSVERLRAESMKQKKKQCGYCGSQQNRCPAEILKVFNRLCQANIHCNMLILIHFVTGFWQFPPTATGISGELLPVRCSGAFKMFSVRLMLGFFGGKWRLLLLALNKCCLCQSASSLISIADD